ncbi:hypothetical protein EYZ11_008131 [Aspergillus tanneri]|uniref:SMP-30/Gluconolactonase/LRE-like region domain-containing protein n=1 Tax=Aspergillus tanneri TaxID=1220188 RepID=A0A4S3JGT9_9EURO|nr:uncharacterized protein ATNIH1004_002111 [Aspergillus tanneri]KAA8649440.1 hypothetical protein ATNIH1004_002111 [Aspergillus tanneri]THC92411.1 hypothetical protein EYZ11_008131 [Aspergillus tanneri]
MREFSKTFLYPALLLAANVGPAQAKPTNALRRGLRARDNGWKYNPEKHDGPRENASWNPWRYDPKKHDGPKGNAGSSQSKCAPISGDITIDAFQLYPEHADYNPDTCLAYLSVLYNSTVAVYDPAKKAVVDTLEFPGLSFNPALHVSGVVVDPKGLLSVIVDAGAAFDTQGQNISGENFLLKVDPKSREVLWRRNLTDPNGLYGGYQDAAHDDEGNTFALGTYPSSIIKVNEDGTTATPWYLQPNPDHTIHGLTGFAVNGDTLLSTDGSDGQLYRFNMKDQAGKKVLVPLTGNKANSTKIGNDVDGIILPPRFDGKVLLVSDNSEGTVVLRSRDGWASAERLGSVPNKYLSESGSSVDNVQIGESLYSVIEYFMDSEKVPGTLGGNRSKFPLVDITEEVLRLLN